MGQHGEASDRANRGEGSGRDPLASPTLAALYVSQGHADVAEAIYAQLGRRPDAAEAASTGRRMPVQGVPASLLLEKLLALREAARRIRGAGIPSPRPGHEP